MTKEEYAEAKKLVEEVKAGDVKLGLVLHTLLDHLGDLSGVVTPVTPAEALEEDAPIPLPRRSRV